MPHPAQRRLVGNTLLSAGLAAFIVLLLFGGQAAAQSQLDTILRGLTGAIPSYQPPRPPPLYAPPYQPPVYTPPAYVPLARPQATPAPHPATPPIVAAQPGFDCAAAHTRLERMICSSRELSALDAELGAAFRSTGGKAGPFAADETHWLAQRNQCATPSCVAALYRVRIAMLQAAASGAGTVTTTAAPLPAGLGAPPALDGAPAAVPVSDTASAGTSAVAQRWALPTRLGLPALMLGHFVNDASPGEVSVLAPPDAYWQQERAHAAGATGSLLPQQAAWTRAIRALGLAAVPDAVPALDDVALRNLACNFLDPNQRAAYYGRSPLYGDRSDVCAAGPIQPGATAAELSPGLVPLLHEGGARFRAEALPDIMRTAPALPLRFVLSWPVTIQAAYDRTRGGYPLFSGYLNTEAGQNTRIFGSPLDAASPRFWPLPFSDATHFETERATSREPLHFAMIVTVTGPAAATAGATRDQTGLPDGMIWRFTTGSIGLYADDALTRRLHEFPAPAAPGQPVATEAGAGAGAPTAGADAMAMARRNGAQAVAAWKLPAVDGTPVVMRTPAGGPALNDLRADGFTPSWMAWPLAMRALGMSLAPETVSAMPDQALLLALRPYMPASQLAAIGPGQRCDATGQAPGCEFVLHDSAVAARAQTLPRVIAAAPKLPLRLTLVVGLRPGVWEPARGGFRLNGTGGSMGGPDFPLLFGSRLDTPVPDFWPASEAEARAYVARAGAIRPGMSDPMRGMVYLAIPLTITGRHEYPHAGGTRFDEMTGLPQGSAWSFEPGEAALYADPELRQKLHGFGPPRRLPAALIGTPEAEQPKPAAPLAIGRFGDADQDAALLLLLRTGTAADGVNWPQAATTRLSLENRLRRDLDWVRSDSWGVFFDRPFDGQGAPADAAEVSAFRRWTERRAAALPDSIVLRQAIWAASGPVHLIPFDDHTGLMHSAWPAPSSLAYDHFRQIAAPLQATGVQTAQMLPVGVQVQAADTVLLMATPQPAGSYALDLPHGVPKPASDTNPSDAAATLRVAARLDGTAALPPAPGAKNPVVLLRLQPVSATLVEPDTVVATASFAPAPWPTPLPAAPAPSAGSPRLQAGLSTGAVTPKVPGSPASWQGPPPEARLAAGPYGPDMLGIRIGSGTGEAEALIRAHMTVTAVLDTEVPTGTGLLAPAAMLRGRVFIGSDQSDPRVDEQIAVFEVPSHAPGKVVAAWRSLYVADGAWESVSHQLVDKYGPPQPALSAPAQMLVWAAGPPERCRLQSVQWPRWAANPAFPGRQIEKVQGVSMPLPTSSDPAALAGCGPMFEADRGGTATFADHSAWFRLTTKLFDPAALAWLASRYVADAPNEAPSAKLKL